jgi:hypothetical protein
MTRTTGIGRRLRGAASACVVALCAAGCAGLGGSDGGGGGSGGGDPDRPREPRDPGGESGDGDNVGNAAVGRAELVPATGPLRRVRIADARLRIDGKYGDVGIPMNRVERFFRAASKPGAFVLQTTDGDRVIGKPAGEGVDLDAKGGGTTRVAWADIRELRPNAKETEDSPASFAVVLTANEDLYVARSVDEKSGILAVAMRCGPRIEVPLPEVRVSAAGVRRIELAGADGIGYDSESARNGRRITKIHVGGAAERAGLREGDVVERVDGRLLSKGESIGKRRDAIVRGTELYALLEVRRGEQRQHYLMTR